MSRSPSATETTWPGPLVTSDASAAHDHDSAHDESHRASFQRHFSHDHSLLPTPKLQRASLKPTSSVSTDDSSGSVYAPQLSERDSIFATHYLPSEGDSGAQQLSSSDPATPKAAARHLSSADDDVRTNISSLAGSLQVC